MLDEGTYTITTQNIHKLGWKAQLLKSAGVSIFGHGYGFQQYPHFYDKITKKCKMLPHPYMGSDSVEKGNQFFKKNVFLHQQNQLKYLLWFQ